MTIGKLQLNDRQKISILGPFLSAPIFVFREKMSKCARSLIYMFDCSWKNGFEFTVSITLLRMLKRVLSRASINLGRISFEVHWNIWHGKWDFGWNSSEKQSKNLERMEKRRHASYTFFYFEWKRNKTETQNSPMMYYHLWQFWLCLSVRYILWYHLRIHISKWMRWIKTA